MQPILAAEGFPPARGGLIIPEAGKGSGAD
jgi:hypothetical protein